MVAEMLRLGPGPATEISALIAPRMMGNPYETVEVLNVLRHEGVLVPATDGWRWDAAALREGGRSDVAKLLAERAEAMPAPTRALLDVMACLAGRSSWACSRLSPRNPLTSWSDSSPRRSPTGC